MKPALILFLLFFSSFAAVQTDAKPRPSPCPDLQEFQDELKDTKALIARMQNRVITMRNSAGTVRDFEVRNALQVNADAWQDLVDDLKARTERLQTRMDRCGARERIESAKPQ